MTEVLNGILRAVRQPTAAKMATGFDQSKPIRPNALDRIGGTAIYRNALVANEKRLATSHCDEPSIA